MDKIKVFVVDDSVVARNMLIRTLADADDIEVAGEAGSAQGSVIMLEEVKPDVILLEASIGGMNLNDVVKEIKNINLHVKIILCIDAIHSEKAMMATEFGADDFVRKPYNKQNVLRAVRSACGR
ncbi:MAG: response regulator [Clostridiales bacterium]|jgi:chemotaxis response regulator CheB|nr:response regulator [Clostridiales bacterium]